MTCTGPGLPSFNPSDSGTFHFGPNQVQGHLPPAPRRDWLQREQLRDLALASKQLGPALIELIHQIDRVDVVPVLHVTLNGLDFLAMSDGFHLRTFKIARDQAKQMGFESELEQHGGCALVIKPGSHRMVLVRQFSADLGPCDLEIVTKLLQKTCEYYKLEFCQAGTWREAQQLIKAEP